MITTYDKYKDSCIEWIGEIPEHWKIRKIKHSCYVKGRVGWKGLKSSEFLTDGFSYLVTGTDFKNDVVDWENCYHIDKDRYNEDPYIQLQNEDLLITKDGTIGKLAVVTNLNKPACLNSGIFVVRSTKDDFTTRFLLWVLKSNIFTDFNGLTAYGSTIQHLYQNVFVEFSFAFPPIKTQFLISDFLQKKTSEIDRIIANKQKLIAFYEEEKQAIIIHAVTKGLDPNVKMKVSGVEWLGEIPEHWEVKKLNYCFGQIGSGTTPTSGKPEYYENGEFNWLQTGDLNDSEIFETSKKITQKALVDYSTLRFYPLDSIVIAMYGATIGKTGILKIESTTNQACCVLSKPKNMFPKYVFYWFNAVKKHIISLSYGGGQPNINQEQIRSLKIQQPSIDEQKLIVEYIENEIIRLSVIIEKFYKQIDLLQEYRTTLISEVVTGKVKITE